MAYSPEVYVAFGAAAYWAIQNVAIPYGRQIRDATYTNPPEQSQRGE